MHAPLNFRAQKWILKDRGRELIVENAWTWGGTTQERVRLNGAVIHASQELSIPMRWTDVAVCDWPGPETRLIVQWKSGIFSILARARLNGKTCPWTDYMTAKWQGPHGVWPD
jgi:hypothetical protein